MDGWSGCVDVWLNSDDSMKMRWGDERRRTDVFVVVPPRFGYGQHQFLWRRISISHFGHRSSNRQKQRLDVDGDDKDGIDKNGNDKDDDDGDGDDKDGDTRMNKIRPSLLEMPNLKNTDEPANAPLAVRLAVCPSVCPSVEEWVRRYMFIVGEVRKYWQANDGLDD